MLKDKTLLFVFLLTSIVALTLSFLFYGLKERVVKNEEKYLKSAILSALDNTFEKTLSDDEKVQVFDNNIKQLVINSQGEILDEEEILELGYGSAKAEKIKMSKERKKAFEEKSWPLYIYTSDKGKTYYIVNVIGMGLWDEIWGYVSIEADKKTIAGVSFDHKAETPGLGAEIKDSKSFQKSFIGKTLQDDATNYRGIVVRKGGAKNPEYEVDAISGATITGDGVTAMLKEGISAYGAYFSKINE